MRDMHFGCRVRHLVLIFRALALAALVLSTTACQLDKRPPPEEARKPAAKPDQQPDARRWPPFGQPVRPDKTRKLWPVKKLESAEAPTQLPPQDRWIIVERVSERWDWAPPTSETSEVSVSADGRYVAFASAASDLVGNDTNGESDIFVYDRVSGNTEVVSVGHDGTPAQGRSYRPKISADGNHVAFYSTARNLVPGGFGGSDVFVRDRTTGQTHWVSFAPGMTESNLAAESPSISADGGIVAFSATSSNLVPNDTNGVNDVFIYIRDSNQIKRVSVSGSVQANASSGRPSVSDDGRYIAFFSNATNLVADDSNEHADVFVHDRIAGTTERVSLTDDDQQANHFSYTHGHALSADGRFVAFRSAADNLVADDNNNRPDIFVRDRVVGATTRVSVSSDGEEANEQGFSPVAISGDGDHVLFTSYATNLVDGDTNDLPDLFVHDRTDGTTRRIDIAADGTQADQKVMHVAISADAGVIAFVSPATTLIAGDRNGVADLFLSAGTPPVLTRPLDGCRMTEPDADSGSAHMSGDGRYVAFLSEASNLVDGDTNGARDVFVWDRVTLAQERVSTAFDGAEANGPSGAPRISTDGRYVAFTSGASNLVPDDNNGRWDLFLRDRIAGTTVRLVDSDMLVPSPDTDSVSFTHRFAFYSMSADARLFALGFRPETASVRILNRITGMIEQITAPGGGAPDDSGQSFVIFPWLSLDGSKLAFDSLATNLVADDTNEIRDVFILDRQSGSFDRLGDQTIPSTVPGSGFVASTLSADNRYIALATGPMYNSDYVYPERAVVFDRIDRVVSHTIASDPTRSLFAVDSAQISPDARFVAVASRNENFVPDSYYDAGFFIVNLTTGVRADLINSGGFGGFTDDGRFIALSSATNGLVLHDTNDLWDVFVAQHLTPVTAMAGPRCPGMP